MRSRVAPSARRRLRRTLWCVAWALVISAPVLALAQTAPADSRADTEIRALITGLGQSGCRTTAVCDGSSALETIRSEHPDLVVAHAATDLGIDLTDSRPMWAPWRSYASMHLWRHQLAKTVAVLADGPGQHGPEQHDTPFTNAPTEEHTR